MAPDSTLMRPRRPAAVQAFNVAGRFLEKTGLWRVSLTEDALLKAALRRTGLDAFEDESFREPLRRLLDSLNRESRLNFMGRLAASRELLQLLVNRLHIEHDRRAHPEIAAGPITRPLFIIGMPRTGTTLLHALLAQDPDNRSPLTWEVMFPSPPDSSGGERRIRRAAKDLAWLDRIAPDFKSVHLADARLPQECIAIMSHTFMSDEFDVLFNVPGYRAWMEQQDLRPVYAWHRRFLQHLQHRLPAPRWVLKAPSHMLAPEALFAEYPDAQVVQTHREPLEVLASTASLTTIMRSAFSDSVDPAAIGRETSEFWAESLEHFMRVRQSRPPEQCLDIHFEELLREPIKAVRRLYAHFGGELSAEIEERMRRFLAANPRDKHGRHHYSLAQFGLEADRESPRFDRYRERFHLPGVTGSSPLNAAL